MKVPPFALERFFARYEFSVRHNLAASDCESTTVGELLALEPGAADELARLPLGYTEAPGQPELRRAISRLYDGISPDDVIVHVGAEEAIFTIMHAALATGDHAVVHAPAYQSLHSLAEAAGATVTPWTAREDEGWALDPGELDSLVGPATRVVVVNLPHNPTGYLMDGGRFLATVEACRQRGLVLLCDEVYRELEPDPALRLPAACEVYERAVSLGVMSKAYGLPGLRIGWVATRDAALRERIAEVKDYLSICASAPAELLARVALTHRETLLERNRALVRDNLVAADAFFAAHRDRFEWRPPVAGPVAFPRLRGGGAERLCQRAVEQAGVLLAPGRLFLSDDEHFRIGLGRRDFPAGIAALDAWLRAA